MRFQNVKAEELEGPIKLSGFNSWSKQDSGKISAMSVLLASCPGTGKGAAVGSLGENLHYDIVRCRLSQLLDYPNPDREFKALLDGTEHLHRTVVWLDGLDRFFAKLTGGPEAGSKILADWLKTERGALTQNEVMVVATAQSTDNLPSGALAAFDQTFSQ